MLDDSFIPFSVPELGEDEISEVVAVLRSGWLTTGPRTVQFEQEFRDYVGSEHALAVNSCTAGLHLALAALGIGPGDEVITTALTFCATVNTILHVGAKPVIVDVCQDLNIDPAAIEAAITPRTRAIIPVHIAGLACDMDAIWDLAKKYDLKVIEDAAHAAGTRYKGRLIGSGPSDAVAFSFYATKNLSTGEGGMVTTHSSELLNKMRVLCLHGINRDAWARYSQKGNWYYEVVDAGFKYNLTDIASAIGIHQLRKLDAMNARRKQIAERYTAAFSEMCELEVPIDDPTGGHAWHLYVLRLNLDHLTRDRGEIFNDLREAGIGCSVHFIPIPLHPFYRDNLDFPHSMQRALSVYPRLISLPLHSGMSEHQVDRVIGAVRKVVGSARKESQRTLQSANANPQVG
jgi:dTDP-4-amino-4,6-dideoxygalactose transaminase